MIRFSILVLTALTFLSCSSADAADRWSRFIGTWEYHQVNSGSITGYDPEGERLVFTRSGGSVAATYFGLERMGDEGLYYTATAVTKLALRDSVLSFVVPARSLYEKRPGSLHDAKRMKATGFTRYELRLQGQLVDGRLRLTCTSEAGECPDGIMIFAKMKER
ncbi:MAG TPA: hypothetical protein VFT57_00895 [Gemmatimonadaceae bacterium]|jgi:hypothetical protein|nr:hypothetical protein [Gemmatimonadaceae bacterium]